MTCTAHQAMLPKGQGVKVNGIVIPRDLIAREVQHYPSRTPLEAWKAAAQALAVRELLLQEARRLDVSGAPTTDEDGCRETAEEATLRELIAPRSANHRAPTLRPAGASMSKICNVFAQPTSTKQRTYSSRPI